MKKFYKEKIIIKYCKAPGCSVLFRPKRGSVMFELGYCFVHRREFYAQWWKEYGKEYFQSLTLEQQIKYKESRYKTWLLWTKENVNRRRELALESYHRNKEKHRDERNEKRRERYKKNKLKTQA